MFFSQVMAFELSRSRKAPSSFIAVAPKWILWTRISVSQQSVHRKLNAHYPWKSHIVKDILHVTNMKSSFCVSSLIFNFYSLENIISFSGWASDLGETTELLGGLQRKWRDSIKDFLFPFNSQFSSSKFLSLFLFPFFLIPPVLVRIINPVILSNPLLESSGSQIQRMYKRSGGLNET